MFSKGQRPRTYANDYSYGMSHDHMRQAMLRLSQPCLLPLPMLQLFCSSGRAFVATLLPRTDEAAAFTNSKNMRTLTIAPMPSGQQRPSAMLAVMANGQTPSTGSKRSTAASPPFQQQH